MRKFLISALMASSVVAIAPVSAQYRGDYDRGRVEWNRGGPSRQAINELLRDLNRVETRIDRSVDRRIISRREAMGLHRDASRIENQLNRSGRDGISGREFARLRMEVNQLEQRLRSERRDRDDRRY